MGAITAIQVMFVDCDGVLPLWFYRKVFEKRKSSKGGGIERGGELLSSWLVLPSQEKCDTQSEQSG